jgi:molybdate transport system substrate-binding protein
MGTHCDGEVDMIGTICRGLLILCILLAPLTAQAQGLMVFAAASLTDAMKDLSVKWASMGHPALRLNFDGSSKLAHEIEQGAQANIFASADEKWMDYLVGKKLIAADARKVLFGNDLVLIMPTDVMKLIVIKPDFDLLALLGSNGRIAIGDPDYVPAGIYGKQALTKLDLWGQVAQRLARADNVRNAVAMVEHGETPIGIVYRTDAAVSAAVAIAGVFPSDSHEPIRYSFGVVSSGDTPEARALMTFLAGPEAQAAFVARGFMVE